MTLAACDNCHRTSAMTDPLWSCITLISRHQKRPLWPHEMKCAIYFYTAIWTSSTELSQFMRQPETHEWMVYKSIYIYIYMCVCVCVYTHTHIYIYTHTRTHIRFCFVFKRLMKVGPTTHIIHRGLCELPPVFFNISCVIWLIWSPCNAIEQLWISWQLVL